MKFIIYDNLIVKLRAACFMIMVEVKTWVGGYGG